MKKFLVTGGAGFIGSNFIRHLLQKHNDIEVVNLDKLTYAGNRDNLKDIADSPGYKFVHGDICNEQLVNDLMGEIHAGRIAGIKAIKAPSVFETNHPKYIVRMGIGARRYKSTFIIWLERVFHKKRRLLS